MTETYSTNWDIDKYKDDTEPEHHWFLRREFLRVHKGKFPEDYLVCLARVYSNVEIMECTYPAALMRRISELSKDINEDYKEKKRNSLQRTFVSASNAAENKIKKRGSDVQEGPGSSKKAKF